MNNVIFLQNNNNVFIVLWKKELLILTAFGKTENIPSLPKNNHTHFRYYKICFILVHKNGISFSSQQKLRNG